MSNRHEDGSQQGGPHGAGHLKRMALSPQALSDQNHVLPTMSVVTGLAGVGKTIAVSSSFEPTILHRNRTMKSTILRFLREVMLHRLSEQTPGTIINTSETDATAMITQFGLKLILVDGADQLDKAHGEALRIFSEKTGCPVVLTVP